MARKEASIIGIAIAFVVFFVLHLYAFSDNNWIEVKAFGVKTDYGLWIADAEDHPVDDVDGAQDFDCKYVKDNLGGRSRYCLELEAAQGFAATSLLMAMGMLFVVFIQYLVQTRSPWADKIPKIWQSPVLLGGACIVVAIFMLISALSMNTLFRRLTDDDFFDDHVSYGPGFGIWIACFLTYLALGLTSILGLETPERLALDAENVANEKAMLESP